MKNQFLKLSKKGWLFLALVVVFSAIPYFFIIQEETTDSDWTILLMWMPALAAIVMRVIYKEGLFKGVSWNPFKSFNLFLLAAFIPFTIEVLSILIGLKLGALELKPEFLTFSDGLIAIRGTALLFGASAQPWYVFIPNYLLSFFAGVIFYSLTFALGEEYGWRGYLQKEWASSNAFFGFAAIGVVWGLWHLPGILLGHNFPDYPLLGGFVLMPLVTIAFSICFGLVFNKTRVIWIPVVFHGAVNISTEISNTALIKASTINTANDAVWIGLWVLTTIIFWQLRHKFD
jgi:membrane protease YdiL (CAAX protease family)